MVRVRGIEDARRLSHELDGRRPAHAPPGADVAPPTGAGSAGIVAEAGDRIALDLADLATAEAELTRRYDELAALLDRAAELEGPLGDGKGPVALHMRRAFGLRAGDLGGGVRGALRSYLEELAALRDALHEVGATHRAEDAASAEAMRRL